MSATERIGLLQNLLARVTKRKSEPRAGHATAAINASAPVRTASGSSMAPQRVTMDIAAPVPAAAPMTRAPTPMPGPAMEPPRHSTLQTPAPRVADSAREPTPVPARTSQGTESWGASPPVVRASSGSWRAPSSPPQVPLAEDDLPDLDLVETTSKTGETRSSLMPSGAEPGEADGSEFHLPSIRPPANVAASADASIDFDPSADAGSLQIDHSPLASAVAPREAQDDEILEATPEPFNSNIAAPPTSHGAAAGLAAGAAATVAVVAAGVAAGVAAVSAVQSMVSAVRSANSGSVEVDFDDEILEATPEPSGDVPMRSSFGDTEAPPPAVQNTRPIHDPSRTTIEVAMMPGVPPASTRRSEPPAGESTTQTMERFVAPQLPDEQLIEMRGVPGASRGASFRVLLERSLSLRLK